MWIFQGQFVRKRMGDGVEKEGRLSQKRYQDCGSPALSLSIYISIYLSISVYLHTHTQSHKDTVGSNMVEKWPKSEFIIWYGTRQICKSRSKRVLTKETEPDGDLASRD